MQCAAEVGAGWTYIVRFAIARHLSPGDDCSPVSIGGSSLAACALEAVARLSPPLLAVVIMLVGAADDGIQ